MIAELKTIVGSENVSTDQNDLNTYGVDWTKAFTPKPSAVVFPQSTQQVMALMKFASKEKIPVVPSGGRTGLSGGAVATQGEIVLSLQKMNRIFEVNTTANTLRCEAGVVTETIQKACEEKGKYFPIDFASKGSSHIGGNIATNAGGVKVVRYGLTREWVLGLTVITAQGERLDLNGALIKNNTGYDLRQLFIGSEGTLGIITECILKITEPPKGLIVELFALESIDAILGLFALAREKGIVLTAYEFFGQFEMDLVARNRGLKSPFQGKHPFYALMEMEQCGEGPQKLLDGLIEAAFEKGLIVDGVQAQTSAQASEIWSFREGIAEAVSAYAVPHKNDISLPVMKIPAFMKEFKTLCQKIYPGFEIALFGHIGDGNIHVNVMKPKDMDSRQFFKHAHEADSETYALVQKFGGSISAEHGIGLTKKDFLHFSRSAEELHYMRLIKKAFDPQGILNPGKIL